MLRAEEVKEIEYPDASDMVGRGRGYSNSFRPYVPAEKNLPELTLWAVAMGLVLGLVFGASSIYLVLKVGLTVSASIPIAVLSMTFFRFLSKTGLRRDASILEHNITQTTGSASESLAFGIGMTLPALTMIGYDLSPGRIFMIVFTGALLGVLMSVPIRRALVVEQHGVLKYPEGTACAEVLKAGQAVGARHRAPSLPSVHAGGELLNPQGAAMIISVGFVAAAGFTVAGKIFRAWKETAEKVFGQPFEGGSVGLEANPMLLGVGYIVGPRIASILCAGGVFAYLILIPAIKYFGGGMTTPLAPGFTLISEMSPDMVRDSYVLYIAAGAVTAGGLISLCRSLPVIWAGLKDGLKDVLGTRRKEGSGLRTDDNLSMKVVLSVIGVLAVLHLLFNVLDLGLIGVILFLFLGFAFVTVSARLTGAIGSSSTPVSGLTVGTLLLTCMVFLLIGRAGASAYLPALAVGGIVCTAASLASTTSQDLKTGFLVGATPKYQQIAMLIGATVSASCLCWLLIQLNNSATEYVPAITLERVPADHRLLPADVAPRLTRPDVRDWPRVAADGSQVSRDYLLLENDPAKDSPVAGVEPGRYLVDEVSGKLVYKFVRNIPEGLRADPTQLGGVEKAKGQEAAGDENTYRVWFKTEDPQNGTIGKYLVNGENVPVYYVDQGMGGVHRNATPGVSVEKYYAPKAVMMSYIVKGILGRELPWGLIFIGVFIAITLELTGLPSLAFAVGLYLPLSSTTPILAGGLMRWTADLYLLHKGHYDGLTEEEVVAAGDRSPGTLLAVGYIAGGAMAGVAVALMTGVAIAFGSDKGTSFLRSAEEWSEANNPLYSGAYADALSLLPFAALLLLIYLVGSGRLLGPGLRRAAPRARRPELR